MFPSESGVGRASSRPNHRHLAKSALPREMRLLIFRERRNEPDTSARVSSETRSEAVCAPSESQSSLP